MTSHGDKEDKEIEAAIAKAVAARGSGKSVCPSEVARDLAPDWRALMPDIRRVAQRMADRGEVAILQKGEPVRADAAGGPIRLALPNPQEPD